MYCAVPVGRLVEVQGLHIQESARALTVHEQKSGGTLPVLMVTLVSLGSHMMVTLVCLGSLPVALSGFYFSSVWNLLLF